jgi:hypothetical protein
VKWIHQVQNSEQWPVVVNTAAELHQKAGNFLATFKKRLCSFQLVNDNHRQNPKNERQTVTSTWI